MIRKFVATLLLITLPALPALAGKPDNPGKGKGKGNSANSHGGGSSNGGSHGKGGSQGGGGGPSYDSGGHHDAPHFSSHDRDYWHDYWRGEYEHGNCPPGLAKKHNGCMPPGQAKKRYVIGQRLPAGFVVLPVPVLLLPRLAPCPPGYYYGMIDGDLVQLAVGTLLVVDAIDGLLNY